MHSASKTNAQSQINAKKTILLLHKRKIAIFAHIAQRNEVSYINGRHRK